MKREVNFFLKESNRLMVLRKKFVSNPKSSKEVLGEKKTFEKMERIIFHTTNYARRMVCVFIKIKVAKVKPSVQNVLQNARNTLLFTPKQALFFCV